jgi:hypothetical protein
MGRGLKAGLVVAVVTGTLALTLPAWGSVSPTARQRAAYGVTYLVSQQNADGSFPGFSAVGSTADGVLATVAARTAGSATRRAITYLEAHAGEAGSIGQKAKLVLAAVAAGRDPRSFGGHNLVQEIRTSMTPEGRFGASTPVLEDGLAVLALDAAGVVPPRRAFMWLAGAQCADGGWQYDEPSTADDNSHCVSQTDPANDFYPADTNTSAYAVMALATHPRQASPAHDPFAFFRAVRAEVLRTPRMHRGYAYTFRRYMFDPGAPLVADANSTALVLQAFYARGKEGPRGARRALTALQYRLCGERAGAFAYSWQKGEDGRYHRTGPNAGATIGAVPALVKKALPLASFEGDFRPAPKPKPC